MTGIDHDTLEFLVRLAEDAGRIVMESSRAARQKEDGTDLTPADIRSHAFLVAGIRQRMGEDIQILSEEGGAVLSDIRKGTTVVIDPLDGTTNFKNGKRNFAVLLAVLQDGKPVFGVAVAPAYGVTACGGTIMKGAELRLHARKESPVESPYRQVRRLSALTSAADAAVVPKRFVTAKDPEDRAVIQSAMTAFQQRAGNASFVSSSQILGSLLPVLKKNVGYRLYEATRPNQRPGDWDLAAWDAILRGVGGIMTSAKGCPLVYGAAGESYKHQGFVCWRRESDALSYAATFSSSARTGVFLPPRL